MKSVLLLATSVFLALCPMLRAGAEEASKTVKLELVGGDSISGVVSSVKEGSVNVITDYGVIRVPVTKLTEASKKQLGISAGNETEQLRARVAELEGLVERLRNENTELRKQQTAGGSSSPQALVARPSAPAPAPAAAATPSASEAGASFWISSTGKRHNSHCRYYGTSKGSAGTATQGTACKVCGG